jgi:transmembrane sensor
VQEPLASKLRAVALSDEQVETQWHALGQRLDREERARGRRKIAGGVLSAAALAAAVLFGVGHRGAPERAASGEAAGASRVALADGSVISVDPGGDVDVQKNEPREVRLVLARGRARFSVAHDEARPFTIQARDVLVRVVGTELAVAIEGPPDRETVRVTVDRGVVEIAPQSEGGAVHRVAAGQAWSGLASAAASAPGPGAPAAAASEAPSSVPSEAPSSVPSEAPSSAPARSAKSLFEAANQARRAGKLDAAAALYRELVARHPADPRARLAALELGRLQMATGRGDAEKALEQAAEGPSGSTVHEDALAKLVALHDTRGEVAACKQARDRYLASYPNGIHVAAVRGSCAPR